MPEPRPSIRHDLAWHASATFLIALLPAQLYFGVPVTLAPITHRAAYGGLAGAYAMAAAFLLVRTLWRRSRPTVLESGLVAASALGGLFLLMALQPMDYSRGVVVVSTGLSLLLVTVPSLLFTRAPRGTKAALTFAAASVLGTVVWGMSTRDALEGRPLLGRVLAGLAEPFVQVGFVPSMLYNLEVTTVRNHFENEVAGGGIAPIGEGLLVFGGDGSSWFVEDLAADSLSVEPLTIRVPQNREARDSRDGSTQTPTYFRVTDVLVTAGEGSSFDLFVAHSHWNTAEQCTTVRVSTSTWPSVDALIDASGAPWTTLYEAQPCTALESEGQGGRLVEVDEVHILLSLGDHEYDGVTKPEQFAQDAAVDYGKTVLIDRSTGEARHFTSGHRNPQGLYRAPTGEIWSTEHGPRGGDELNRLVDGLNYGWPTATYGTAYFQWGWPLAAEPGSHRGFEPPFYSWLPSIGVSNLIGVERDRFAVWQGDLLVGSLRSQSLWRVRIRRAAPAYVEQIPVGVRVRDIVEAPDGRVLLWSDAGDLVLLSPADTDGTGTPTIATGEATFAVNCSECHSVDRNAGPSVGPNLAGVVGRSVAADPSYPYSDALAGVEGAWTRERLAEFLAGPTAFAEGTRMAIPGMQSESAIEGLLLFLETTR